MWSAGSPDSTPGRPKRQASYCRVPREQSGLSLLVMLQFHEASYS